MENLNFKKVLNIGIIILMCALVFVVFFLGVGYANSHYNVWAEGMNGKAILAHAQYSKDVAIAEARAKMEAAELLAEAEIRRAHGIAEANNIIGASLKNNDNYLRYLWIQNLENSKEHQVIYIPTEAGLPILESQRLRKS